jgi:tetratricopeptide (TPR) repeat protein
VGGEAEWRSMAGGLVTVRDAVRKQLNGATRSVERTALAKVAGNEAFAGLGPAGEDRGRWIVARVRQRLLELERGADDSPSGRAVRCWARYVDEGLTPVELHAAHGHLIINDVPARTDVARRNRVQSLMWAGGARGDKDSLAGVLTLAAELRTALSTGLPDGTRMDATTFGYEWERLSQVLPAGRDLLQALARLAPGEPFPGDLLREAGDSLPGLAEAACSSAAELRATCSALRDRGLLELDGDLVSVPEQIARHVVDLASPQAAGHWTAAVLRFLTHALRADTHHSESWPEWELGYPHVLALCQDAEERQVHLGDVVYLLDRASVYARECLEDAKLAVALAERAAELSATVADPELTGICLGNLAMAYREANRLADALTASERALHSDAEAFGTDHESYAETLNVYAGILAANGRGQAAANAFAEAVDVLRAVHASTPSVQTRGLLVEAMNDRAGHLLGSGEHQAGRELLEEANRLVRRGEHGWLEIQHNLSRARRAEGDFQSAKAHLEVVRDHCLTTGQNPSTHLVAALADLSEVYRDLGDSRRADAALREAHRVDNALVERLDAPLRDGRSR